MKIWLTGQIITSVWNHRSQEWEVGSRWDVQGVFDSEEKAVSACKTEHYFVMPLNLNEELPHDISETPEGAYYPLAKK